MTRATRLSRRGASLACVALSLVLGACDKPVALGEPTNIIVAAPDSVWAAIESDLRAAVEPHVFTVRNERIFDVAHGDPRSEPWSRLRYVRQILAIGEPADPWIAQALEEVDGPIPTPPAVVQAQNVWSQGQLVTIALVPPGSRASAAQELLPEIGATLLRQYEDWVRSRMFFTGVDSVLADSLRRAAGFSLLVPEVYRVAERAPGVVEFRNDQPDPADLIRNVTVASRPAEEVGVTPEAARQWRMEVVAPLTVPPQVTDSTITQAVQMQVGGNPALQIQGVWSNPPGEWPAGGPYITRVVRCPERTYLLDAWLYAPNDTKYQYMYQLNTILDSFRCGG